MDNISCDHLSVTLLISDFNSDSDKKKEGRESERRQWASNQGKKMVGKERKKGRKKERGKNVILQKCLFHKYHNKKHKSTKIFQK